jgi:hypothetical protein
MAALGLADIGWSNCLRWYEGFHLLTAVTPVGVMTGFGPASSKDQPLAETYFALRHHPPSWAAEPCGNVLIILLGT